MGPPATPDDIEELQVANEEYLTQVPAEEQGAAPGQFWAVVWFLVLGAVATYWLVAS